jgi:hypothetical protein
MRRRLPLLWFFAAGVLSLASAKTAAAAIPGPLSASCRTDPTVHSIDTETYVLSLTFPTTGYTLKLVGTKVTNKTVNISVHYTLARGAHGDIVVTHNLKFVLSSSKGPIFFVVTANHKKFGPAKRILLVP